MGVLFLLCVAASARPTKAAAKTKKTKKQKAAKEAKEAAAEKRRSRSRSVAKPPKGKTHNTFAPLRARSTSRTPAKDPPAKAPPPPKIIQVVGDVDVFDLAKHEAKARRDARREARARRELEKLAQAAAPDRPSRSMSRRGKDKNAGHGPSWAEMEIAISMALDT